MTRPPSPMIVVVRSNVGILNAAIKNKNPVLHNGHKTRNRRLYVE
jgi:hypothetical protein